MANPRTDTNPQLFLIVNGAWSGEAACDLCRGSRVEPDVEALAHAISTVDIWGGSDAVVVARRDPPAVAVIGHLTNQTRTNLDTLGWQIRELLPRTRRLGYRQIEDLVEQLGDRLVSELGQAFLRDASFTAIPRGGLMVLGMLSYALEIELPRLLSVDDDGRPLVVVDDIAVTGYRIRESLGSMPDREIIFAHLLSHPDLRNAIEAWDHRKVSCIAASDLADHAPAHLGPAYDIWRTQRESPERFWVGMPDHVVTPWGEPDTGLWDDSAQRMLHGLRLASDRSMRSRWAKDPQYVPVQIQEVGSGSLRPSPDTIFGELGGDFLVGRSSGGPVVRLNGPAANLWKSFLEADSPDDAVSGVAEVEEGVLLELVGRLTKLGLLTDGLGEGHSQSDRA